jgi:inosose dehydratase
MNEPFLETPAAAGIRFGSEVYTWFMKESGRANVNRLDHMIEIIARAGFKGVQPIYSWMGDLSDPARLADSMKRRGIVLSAMSFVLDWNHEGETEDELREANSVMDFLSRFPGALLCVVQMPRGRFDLEVRRKRLAGNLNALARRAADRGIVTTFHPNSPESSIARTREDYEVLLNGLDSKVIGWTPDVGHIINGGMDPLETMKQYADLINHIHYKDWDGNPEFAVMGEGKVDFPGITTWLRDRGFSGWIVCEDEGHRAIDQPDEVTLSDGAYVRQHLEPLLGEAACQS